jgi:hypothetical protein
MPKYAKKILPSTSVPPLKDQIPKIGRKNQTSKCDLLCYVKMREKHPQYIVYHDLLIKIRSLKIADKATNQNHIVFTLIAK